MRLIHISEGLRMFRRARHVRRRGFHQYGGSPEDIARGIIDECWDKKRQYFRVSAGHFNEFYCRDFGMCAEPLVKLGYRKQVISTLKYALEKFRKHGRITTSISPHGKCFDFPYYGADSLPFIMRALRVAKATSLIREYKGFLQGEIEYYHTNVFDPDADLVYAHRHFSSIKDYARRPSSCYSNCMMFMLADELTRLKLHNPFPTKRIKTKILKTFWNGAFFYDNLSLPECPTGDANTFPFWCGVDRSRKHFRCALNSLEREGLTTPFPLQYYTHPEKLHEYHLFEFFAGDYERDAVWVHLGLCFLDVVKMFDRKLLKLYMAQYSGLIEKYNNFLEVYDSKGRPFHNRFYYSDESMLWVSKWLYLKKFI
ncbi:hypothetical protein KY362_04955 [Candidatus Woesearchaeota archaeon]|nr:hypothetical protein [Candidatus Woesearchaeota archaeon]